jgi:hypothetical protein
VVLGYPPVGSSCIWVCLLNKCEISNGYCHAMTRFGIRPCEQISNYFKFWLNICVCPFKCIDSKYYQCSDFKVEIYSWFIQRRGGTIASLFFCQKTVFLYFENIICPSQKHLSMSKLGYIAPSCKNMLLSNTLLICFLC